MAKITVTVEPSRVPMRVWLKARSDDGSYATIENILRMDAARLRNKLVEELTASGRWDEVIGEPVARLPKFAPRQNFPDPGPKGTR